MESDNRLNLIDEISNSLIKRYISKENNCDIGQELSHEDLQSL
jgi:hypothetical protein